MTPVIDIVGMRVNRLVVLEFAGTDKNKQSLWRCKCDCGNEKVILGTHLRSRKIKSCGCYRIYEDTHPYGHSAALRVMRGYMRHASVRGHVWNLSENAFRDITSSRCFYCNAPPSNEELSSNKRLGNRDTGSYIYNGIDRKDNSIGYILDNCVPCCWKCNKAKGTMTMTEFIEWIKDLSDNLPVLLERVN